MVEKRRTYEERVREREDALQKLESNLAESRLAAAQGKIFHSPNLEEKPSHPKNNKVFMGVGLAIILFLIFAVIYTFRNQALRTPGAVKTEAVAPEPEVDAVDIDQLLKQPVE